MLLIVRMDILSGLEKAYEVGSQVIGDYQRGRKYRLGAYKGTDNIKMIGHYNKQGKRLGIYHG